MDIWNDGKKIIKIIGNSIDDLIKINTREFHYFIINNYFNKLPNYGYKYFKLISVSPPHGFSANGGQ
jgi:hypothetical protein